MGFAFFGGPNHIFQQVSWLTDRRARSAFSCPVTQWRHAAALPAYSDRIVQDLHLIPSSHAAILTTGGRPHGTEKLSIWIFRHIISNKVEKCKGFYGNSLHFALISHASHRKVAGSHQISFPSAWGGDGIPLPDCFNHLAAAQRAKEHHPVGWCSFGTPDAIRTHDLQSRSLTLYPAELRARMKLLCGNQLHPTACYYTNFSPQCKAKLFKKDC